jgi:hypothetical protein
MATKLGQFRDYDEHDVINLFTLNEDAIGTDGGVTNGHFVKISTASGWMNTDELQMIGAAGQDYNNTESQRYGVNAKVVLADANDPVLGMMLYDCKETDENGEKLLYNPRKAAEMGVTISGQSCPIVTKGIFSYSGSVLATDQVAGTGQALYVDANGELTTTDGGGTKVGQCLGSKDKNGHFLIRIDL